MRLAADRVIVRVPATSGNVGPGFDSLGLALGVYDEVEVRLVASTQDSVEVRGEGEGEVPLDGSHLIVRAVKATLEHVGAPVAGVHLRCTNTIPHGRGMGSSASAAVAGIVAARAMLADPHALDSNGVLAIANEFEGHPDNAAPAILGGATVAWIDDEAGPLAVRLPVDPEITATVLIPEARLSTAQARAVLPARVPLADAAFNAGRTALLVEALSGRPELLYAATADRLHQDYRATVMTTSHHLLTALREQGFAATISGAGPCVLVLAARRDLLALDTAVVDLLADLPGWRALRPGIDLEGAQARRL